MQDAMQDIRFRGNLLTKAQDLVFVFNVTDENLAARKQFGNTLSALFTAYYIQHIGTSFFQHSRDVIRHAPAVGDTR